MPFDPSTPAGVMLALLPEVILSVAVLVILVVISWRHAGPVDSRRAGWLALVGLGGAALALWWTAAHAPEDPGIGQMIATDAYRFAGSGLILLMAAGSVLGALGYLEREHLVAPEFYVLLLLAAVGMLFMASAEDLIVLFLGLETMSVAVYVLPATTGAVPTRPKPPSSIFSSAPSPRASCCTASRWPTEPLAVPICC